MASQIQTTFFSVNFIGTLESGTFPGVDDIYCKLSFMNGQDWGIEEGMTQIAKSCVNKSTDGNNQHHCVWNFPIEISYKSTNAFGWPQLILSVYGLDTFGRDVIRGYGTMRMPTKSGQFVKEIRMFKPKASSKLNYLLSWITGRLPEFMDPKFIGKNEGREGTFNFIKVTRVQSSGLVKVSLNVSIKDIEKFGFASTSPVA